MKVYLFSLHFYRTNWGRGNLAYFKTILLYIQPSVLSVLSRLDYSPLRTKFLAFLDVFYRPDYFLAQYKVMRFWFLQAFPTHCDVLFRFELCLIYFHTHSNLVSILTWNNLIVFLFLVWIDVKKFDRVKVCNVLTISNHENVQFTRVNIIIITIKFYIKLLKW